MIHQVKQNSHTSNVSEKSAPFFQAKLTVNQPGDEHEREADAVADQVMRMKTGDAPIVQRMPITPVSGLQRACATCAHEQDKEKEGVQRKETGGGDASGKAAPSIVSDVLSSGGGQPMDGGTRQFMESRFGQDFSQVRIHTDSQAAASASAIQARAYTSGRDVVFGSGEYQPGSESGQRLLAHELVHVGQQGKNHHNIAPSIQRNMGANSRCNPNVHSAPADPIDRLTLIDARAQHMSLGCSHLLFFESTTFSDPTLGGPSYVFNAYRDWFGLPAETSPGHWKSRFRTATFSAQNEAIKHEMQELSNRFKRIHDWLSGSIRYVCSGTASVTIGGCAGPCGSAAAMSCDDGTRKIAICPRFWSGGWSDDVLASFIIHEASHAHLRFSGHPTANAAGRGRNPGCYHGFVQSVYNTGIVTGGCTII